MKYEAKTPFGLRTCELKDDAIRVYGDFPRGHFDVTFKLADLDSSYMKLEQRSPYFMIGMWLTVLGLGAYAAETAFLGRNGVSPVCLYTLAATLASAMVFFYGLKKYPTAIFKTKIGVPAFDILSDGSKTTHYFEFLQELVARIPK